MIWEKMFYFLNTFYTFSMKIIYLQKSFFFSPYSSLIQIPNHSNFYSFLTLDKMNVIRVHTNLIITAVLQI